MNVRDGNDVGDCDDADATDDDGDDAGDGDYEDISITHTKQHSQLDAGPLICVAQLLVETPGTSLIIQ